MSREFMQMVSDVSDRRFLRTFQKLAADKTPCGIFFTTVSANSRQIVNYLRANGINLNCICLLSYDQKKLFQAAENETLIALEEFPNLKEPPQIIFVLDGFFSQTFMDYFKAYGADMMTFSPFDYSENLYNFYMHHLPELYDVHELLADDESKKVFRASITGKLTSLLQDFRFAPEPQYFLEGFLPGKGDIAIDGGAYDGATSADFARQGAKVYAFELDAVNYKNCLPRAEKFGFTIENLGLSDKVSEAFYSQSGTGSRMIHGGGDNGLIAKVVNLDAYVEQKNLPHVDYIKLDIEGAELAMLYGAAKSISRRKPKMAISAYHKHEDLWTLAAYIKSLRADYEFCFRHYRIDCTNYILGDDERMILRHFGLNYFCPSNCEMVLYCK